MEKNKKTVFFDGAFGTYYRDRTGDGEPCELASLTRPDEVYAIHREYIDAGCTAVKTNTFAALSIEPGDGVSLYDLYKASYDLACRAAEGSAAEVYADIGGVLSADDGEQRYLNAAELFAKLGATNFLFETFAEYEVLLPAVDYLYRAVPGCKIIVSFAVSQDGYTRRGISYRHLISACASNEKLFGFGLNCMCGPAHMYSLVKELDLTGVNFSVMPNAGYPALENGRMQYRNNPGYFAQKLAELYSLGCTITGGCCGTTPAHIAEAVRLICKGSDVSPAALPNEIKKTRMYPENRFLSALRNGKKVITVELDPPKDNDASYVVDAARKLKACGADMITVADSPLARTRADSFMISAKIRREAGIEVMPHICCRDKNHIAIKGTLLAGSAEGIRNLLAVTGDSVTDAGGRGVFVYNSYELISLCSGLNAEVFRGCEYMIAAALNVNAVNFRAELDRAKNKVHRGAEVFFTQPVFTDAAVCNLELACTQLQTPVIAGLLPVAGYKNAIFLTNEVKGIDIPQSVIDSLRQCDREQAEEISIAYTMTVVKKIYGVSRGFYIMTPLKRTELVMKLIKEIKEYGK